MECGTCHRITMEKTHIQICNTNDSTASRGISFKRSMIESIILSVTILIDLYEAMMIWTSPCNDLLTITSAQLYGDRSRQSRCKWFSAPSTNAVLTITRQA